MLRSLIVLLLCLLPLAAGADVQVPPLKARVTDLTGTLTGEQQAGLESRLAAFEQQKGSQVAVLIVLTTQPEAIEQYSIRVVEQWKLGRKGVDDGALLLVAKDDHKMRIEVGYGLEGVLNDATCKRIVAETIAPRFKQGDFYGGISAGVDRIMAVVQGESLPEPPQRPSGNGSASWEQYFSTLFFVAIAGGFVLRSLLGRFLGGVVTGGVVGGIVWLLGAGMLFTLMLGFMAFVMTAGGGLGYRGGYFGGSGGFGSGGGSFGGGGFSGGGGGFGGGGASGSW
jgi:uncharacterized protein